MMGDPSMPTTFERATAAALRARAPAPKESAPPADAPATRVEPPVVEIRDPPPLPRCCICFGPMPCAEHPPRLLDKLTSAQRKEYPMATGLLDYFPDALAEVS